MDEQQVAESRVGTVLHGKWRLERLLGVGGMAAVYEATHRIGRRDAIKILHQNVARSAELRGRFEQEAHAVNSFAHPGAVEIRDIDVTEDGCPFLVMELLEGEPLSQRVGRPDGLGVHELLRLTDELLDVLEAAHQHGIIHRDVKPDNLFVQVDGKLKVLDFGIARMREGTGKANRTAIGMRLGTLPYMPPEQIRGLPIDSRADLFAVGAMLFRLVAGRRVHEAPTEAELASKMLTEQAPSLASVAPTAPAGLCLVVDRALAYDREQRYPDAATMQADVRAVLDSKPPPFATEALSRIGPPGIVRSPTAVLEGADAANGPSPGSARSASAPLVGSGSAGGMADAPTSAETPHASPAGSRAPSASAAAVEPTVAAAMASTHTAAKMAATGAVRPSADGPTSVTRAGGAAVLAGAVIDGASDRTALPAGVVPPSATLVSPGSPGALAADGSAGGHARGGHAPMGASIEVVEAAPDSRWSEASPSSAVETLAVPTQPLTSPHVPGAPVSASPPGSVQARPELAAEAPRSEQNKPMAIVWLALGGAVMTLISVVILWWALSGNTSAEDETGEATSGDRSPGAATGPPRAGKGGRGQSQQASSEGASGSSQPGTTASPGAPPPSGTEEATSTPLPISPITPSTGGTPSPPSTTATGTEGGGTDKADKEDKGQPKGKGNKKGHKK